MKGGSIYLMIHVRKYDKKVSRQLVEEFRNISVATIYEASGKKGAVDYRIKPIEMGTKICGIALTVQTAPGDNLMLHKALAVAEEGDVIIATVGNAIEYGYWGELMAVSALARKIEGLVIEGCIRDSNEIINMGFPVFSRGLCIRGTKKETLGLINYTLNFGGAVVNPGDIVVGDDDGLVIVKQQEAEKVLESSKKRVEAEVEKARILSQGVTSVEYNKLYEVFDKLGLVEE